MEVNDYTLEILVREKLADLRAMTARRALVAGARSPRAPFRVRLGAALIALGERMGGTPAPRASRAGSSAGDG